MSGNAPVASSLALLDQPTELVIVFGRSALPQILRRACEAFSESSRASPSGT